MKLYKPFKGDFPVTQTFGANPSYYEQVGQKGHNGIDYGLPKNTPVLASADGTIAFEGWGENNPLAGKVAGIYVQIEHAEGWTGYAQLTKTVISEGQKVKRGQVIGYSGNTGLATGYHLHFEYLPDYYNLKNGYYGRINPAPYMEDNVALSRADIEAEYLVNRGAKPSEAEIQVHLNGGTWKSLSLGFKGENDTRRKAYDAVKAELVTAKKEVTALSGKVVALDEENTTLNATVDALTHSNEELAKRLGETEKALEECESKECPPTDCNCSTLLDAIKCWLENRRK